MSAPARGGRPDGELGLRDRLALERTRLANERTLLAYVRTALALAAGGSALLEVFPHDLALRAGGWFLIAGGAVALAIGAARYLAVRRRFERVA